MNKSNKILLGVLSFVVVCVIGYALFSETITVTGTATVDAKWSFKTTCNPGLDITAMEALGVADMITEGGYKNDTCSVNGNKVTASVNLEYPTAIRWFTITVTNTGTIPAYYINIPDRDDVSQTVKVYDSKTDKLLNTYTYPGDDFYPNVLGYYALFDMDEALAYASNSKGYALWNDTEKLKEIGMLDNNNLGIIMLNPGESVSVGIVAEWFERDAKKQDDSKYSVAESVIEIKLHQYITPDMFDEE